MTDPVFSDEDLRRLKEKIPVLYKDESDITMSVFELEALLHRVDCIERLITLMAPHFDSDEMVLYREWLKSKGLSSREGGKP